MNHKVSGTMILFCLSICSPQHDAGSIQPVHNIRIDGEVVAEALKQVAATYQIVIGFEDSELPSYDKDVEIALDHATLVETMDAIIKADPRYSWLQEPTGAIRVFSRKAKLTLPDVVMPSLRIDNLGRQQTEDLLNASPEIVKWMQQHRCSDLRAIVTVGIWPTDTTKITLTTSGKTLRENLDEVVRSLGLYYWMIRQAATDRGCQARIMLPVPDMPKQERGRD